MPTNKDQARCGNCSACYLNTGPCTQAAGAATLTDVQIQALGYRYLVYWNQDHIRFARAVLDLASKSAAPAALGLTDENQWRDKAKAAWLAEDDETSEIEAYDRGWKDRATVFASTATAPSAPDSAAPSWEEEQARFFGVSVEQIPAQAPAIQAPESDLDIERCGPVTLAGELRFHHEMQLSSGDYKGSTLCQRTEAALAIQAPEADEPTDAMVLAMVRRLFAERNYSAAWEDVMRLAYKDARALATPSAAVSAGPEGYRVFLDGNQWCAVGPGFVNIQESPCAFADTAYLALERLTELEGEATRRERRKAPTQPQQGTGGRIVSGAAMMRSMLSRAAHVTHKPARSCLVTETVNGVTVQCEGRPTWRKTIDGMQPTISFHWFIECRRSSKAKAAEYLAHADKAQHVTTQPKGEAP